MDNGRPEPRAIRGAAAGRPPAEARRRPQVHNEKLEGLKDKAASSATKKSAKYAL